MLGLWVLLFWKDGSGLEWKWRDGLRNTKEEVKAMQTLQCGLWITVFMVMLHDEAIVSCGH